MFQRILIMRGKLVISTGPDEPGLDYQLFNARTGAPSAIDYRGDAWVENGRVVIGDAQSVLLSELRVAAEPTTDSREYLAGWQKGRAARRVCVSDRWSERFRWGYRDGIKARNAAKLARRA